MTFLYRRVRATIYCCAISKLRNVADGRQAALVSLNTGEWFFKVRNMPCIVGCRHSGDDEQAGPHRGADTKQ